MESDIGSKKIAPKERPWLNKWKPGESGNPAGRKKTDPNLVVKAKDLCPEVLDTWLEIMRNEKAKPADRIKAGENIWTVAYGKPAPAEKEAPTERPIVIPAEFIE